MSALPILHRTRPSRHRPGASRRPATRGERGVALIETAMVSLFLVTLILGSLELGLGWRASLTNANAARAGARVGSSQGQADLADQAALLSVAAGIKSLSGDNIVKVVIFHATSTSGTVPAACLTAGALAAGGVSGSECNVYSGTYINTLVASPVGTAAQFAGPCGGGRRDRFWCPTNRSNIQQSVGGLDQVGVYVEINHPTLTKILGSTINIKDIAVMRIEPDAR